MPNSAAVVDLFRAQNAQLLLNDFASGNYYCFIGDELPFTAAVYGSGATDANPPQAYSTVGEIYNQYRGAFGAKKINSTDVVPAIRNVAWTSGTVYSQYDAYDINYGLADFYVVTDALNVYKCLSNYGNVASTVKPTATTANASFTTADNYRWKYMYNITAGQAQQFGTLSFVPAYNVASNNIPAGSIESYRITNGGSNYPANTTVAVTLTGDGSSATANAFTNSSGIITHIEPVVVGSGYTFARVTIPTPASVPGGSAGTTATALANIAPTGGHGSNNINELFARYALITVQFVYGESGNISTNTSFRQIALVRNPTVFGSSTTLATAASYRQTYGLTLSSVSGTFVNGDLVQNPAGTHVGYVVEYTAGVLYVNMIRGSFTTETVQKSDLTATASVSSISNPGLQPFSGTLLYYENRGPVTRSNAQIDLVYICLEY